MINKFLVTFLMVLAAVNVNGQSTFIALQPNGSTGIDAILSNTATTTNYSTSVNFEASRDASNSRKRSVIFYDLSSIPSNAIIISANLTLYGTAHSGTNPAYFRKNTSSFSEGTVTWNTAPSTSTVGQISLAQSTVATQNYTLNVKAFVQDMVNVPAQNFGWTLIKQAEGTTGSLVFGSSDNSTSGLRPKLEITYCLPVDVKAYMTPTSGSVTADGALNTTILNGVPPYTYAWSDGSTGKDIYNKLPGVYTFAVTDNAGNVTKKDFIIATQNTTMTFTISPDALSGKDAVIQTRADGTLANNNNKNYIDFKAEKGTSGGWFTTRSLLEFNLFCLPANAVITNATLNLYGIGHNSSYRPNDSYLYVNSSPWDEVSTTWNTQPSHTATNSIYLAATTTTNQNAALNVTTHVQNWVQNPNSNYGWKIALADEVTNNYAYMIYGSSDNTTVGLRPNLVITVSIPALTDAQRNWKLEETYDQNGQVIASKKVYMDDLGRGTQSLIKNADGEVFANQTVYDAYGRAAINSLTAYAGNTMTYKTNFMLNTTGQEYNYTNFDVAGKITTPDPVQVGLSNTLGTYYSNLNTLDTWQATSTNPYNRSKYMASAYEELKTTLSAENAFNASSNREARNYTMVCGDELKFILGTSNSYKVKVNTGNPMSSNAYTMSASNYIKATKSITTSPDNKEVISYSIGDKLIASCMSGLSSPDNCSMTSIKNYMDWYGTQSIDIHVPDANKTSLSLPLPTYVLFAVTYTVANADISYVITDQTTETILQSTVDYTINPTTRALTFSSGYLTANTGKPLFLRIRVAYTSTFITSLGTVAVPAGIVQYNLDYGRWSVNYYDFAGNLRKTVSAKGINCSSPGTIVMSTVYDYSHLGQLVAQSSPDEGLVEYAYNTNGQTRFSQNAEQKLNKRFSYVNYDLNGRVVEGGEFSNLTGSGANGAYFQNYYGAYTAPYTSNIATSTIIDNADGLSNTYCNDVSFTSYEELAAIDDVPTTYTYSANYLGKYKNGQVSKTWNANTVTWYKYDIAGRLFASIKQVNDADYISFAGSGNAQIKTYETTYEPYFGYVTNNYYQKNIKNEYAEHQFIFDNNKRLSQVKFVADYAATPTSISKLSYDKLGRIKRNIIGPDLQGLDYVYTLSGNLKAINHPSLESTKDRGGDNLSYTVSAKGTKLDLFGEIIEYFPGDYTRSGTSIEANTIGLYTGQIFGARYKTRNDVGSTITGANYIDYLGANSTTLIAATNYTQQELANRYTYDAFGQLATSTFGTYTNTTNSFTARNDYKEFGVTNNSIGYDANGNITRLKRNAYNVSGSPQLLDNLTYTYSSTGNKHTQVGDAATNSYPSGFNFKNQTGTPATFAYNTNGELTASADENISAITYYPNGQVKQITFTNGNITNHYYDDQGQKYKTKYYNASTTTTKYTWYLFNAMYEYVSSVGSFNLKEVTMGGSGRLGVYKQDATGLKIGIGHHEYELTDHLGNVRVTFKAGTGPNYLEVLSKTDYYAFGGALPGRIWQQSGGDYRYGYQGQEKSTNDVNWDNFELRLYNHDLGRWSAPDPYGQFHSPYIAMGNNPVSFVDPDGGYINLSAQGVAQRNRFISEQNYDRSVKRGRYSYEFLSNTYKDELQDLIHAYKPGSFSGDNGGSNDADYLQALYQLNSKYLGMGFAASCLSSGGDQVSNNTLINNQELFSSLNTQNGSAAMMAAASANIPGPSAWDLMTPRERRDYGVDIGLYENVYHLESAFREKQQVGEKDNSKNGETNDITTGYVYNYVSEYGDKFSSYLDAKGNAWYDKSKESEAYRFMNILSSISQKEVGAFITPQGIYIPDSRNNEFGRAHSLVKTKLNFVGGNPYLYFNKKSHQVIGAIHTHPQLPNGFADQGFSDKDLGFAKYLNKPFFLMAEDGNFEGVYNKGGTLYIYPTGHTRTNSLYNGNYSLINLLK